MADETFLGEVIDAVEERLKKFLEKVAPKEKRYAPFLQPADTVTIPASGFGVMRLSGPTRGRFAYVRRLRVSGQNPLVFVGASQVKQVAFNGGGLAGAVATVPAGTTWTIQSISALYTTDATAGNRTLQLVIKDPTGLPLYTLVTAINQPPSQSDQYSFAPGLTSSANGAPPVVTGPIPDGLVLQPGSTIVFQAQVGGAAGDTVTNGNIQLAQTTNNRADVFICPDDLRGITALAQCPIVNWRDQLPNLPQVNDYAHGELRVGPMEAVYVGVSGPVGTIFVASMEFYEYPDVDEVFEWQT